MKTSRFIYFTLFAILFIFLSNCQKLNLKPVTVELVVINNSENKENSQVYEKVFYDPYILFLDLQKKFNLTEKDIKYINIYTLEDKLYINFYLKKKLANKFYKFTKENIDSLIAIRINGKINSIARINEPIDNGRIQFMANASRKKEVITFLKSLFI